MWPKRLPLFLIAILFLGTCLRSYNLNWDQGHYFHPDERNIAAAVSQIRFFDQLNPHFFAYGGFSIYLYRALGEIIKKLSSNPAWLYDWTLINLISRSVSAFVSSFSIILVFLLSKKIFSEKIGLLAAFFTAFCVSLIQTAHYGLTESLLIFWSLLITLFSFQLLKKPTLRNYLILGGLSGLAIGTKVSAATLLIFPSLAHFLSSRKNFLKKQLFFFLFGLTTFLFFFLSSPYTFLDFKHFQESMNYEGGIVTGRLKVCYVYQFFKTTPYLFQTKNLLWQMGPLLTLFSLLGFSILIATIFRKITKKESLKGKILLASWPLIYFIIVGSWYTKFIRYMVPLLPFFCLFSAWFLMRIKKCFQKIGLILIALTCLTTFFWALAFFSIYLKESTRIIASKWIYQNIPAESKILTEHWDDGLPLPLNGHPRQYTIEALTIYEPDNDEKINYYTQKLSGADYIIINSRRLYGTLMYLPEEYPITSRYYQLLFSGQLGYQKVAEFKSYPSLFGIEINDDQSEETFQVYEHPKVIIFKNYFHLSSGNLIKILKN